MQINVLVPLRYPTKKAYGTNIAYTVKALRECGHKVEIFADLEIQKDYLENPIQPVQSLTIKLLKLLSQPKLGIFSKIAFHLLQVVFGIKSSRVINTRCEENFVITRSPIVAILVENLSKSSTVLLELHHLPNFLEIHLMKRYNASICTVVTNVDFENQIRDLGFSGRVRIIPNVAPDIFHNLSKLDKKFGSPLCIGYAGKATSSGNLNGLQIILDLLVKYPEVSSKAKFLLIGCEEEFNNQVKYYLENGVIQEGSVTTVEHLSHIDLVRRIQEFDVALIPYPETPYFDRSFPIKILEMAAAGIPILASNTKAHRRIFGALKVPLYELNSLESFHAEICKLDSDFLYEQRRSLVDWSRENTYLNKAQTLLRVMGESW